ncbi:dialkylrecorsinol condensing enzyme [bacterium F16]|nr:dialkylrecorsinol condensing enzyme [bacterium F16]
MANKRVLTVYFSQTGQLESVVRSITGPLDDASEINVTYESIRPKQDYPFPWPFWRFLEVFPECVYMDGPAMAELHVPADDEFDLIILAYQNWFLSPALPITGFLQTPEAKKLLKGKPVITIIACRNMWIQGQQKMKRQLEELGATLIDNIVLIDQGNSFANFVTTPRWMLTGNKKPFWGFPPAGVAPDDITRAKRFGVAIAKGLAADMEKESKPMCRGLGAATVNPRLILSEHTAHRSFLIWGTLMRKLGPQGSTARRIGLLCYLTFLITFILTFIPITILLKIILSPLIKRKLATLKAEYEQPSGSDTALIAE